MSKIKFFGKNINSKNNQKKAQNTAIDIVQVLTNKGHTKSQKKLRIKNKIKNIFILIFIYYFLIYFH